LNVASGQTVRVDFATANDSATAPGDYVPVSGTLTFTPGQVTRTIAVGVNGDGVDEPNEAYVMNLGAPVNATIADGTGVGSIVDDDGAPALTVGDVTLTEGNGGVAAAGFTVTLAPASGQTVTVDYGTADGTAKVPGDYTAASGSLTFQPGQTTATVNVQVVGDTAFEADEKFVLRLANSANAAIADGEGEATIKNNDAVVRAPTAALFAPAKGVSVSAPPLLQWRPAARARFYNVQLYRKGRKILSSWPVRPRLKLRAKWKYQGKTYRLKAGVYTWVVWPAYGTRPKPRFGRMVGQSSFRMVSRRR
jgi:hypothetical protein